MLTPHAGHRFLRLPDYDGPITDVTATELACNGGPNPLTKISKDVATVAAGAQITLQWGHTLDSDFAGGLIVDASHKGPMLVYMAKVADALGPIPNSGWFKIYEDGYANGVWAVDKLIANKGALTVTIPSCIAPGDYLFRGELIALHASGSYPGAQLYMVRAITPGPRTAMLTAPRSVLSSVSLAAAARRPPPTTSPASTPPPTPESRSTSVSPSPRTARHARR